MYDITKVSIQEYLEAIGIPTRKEGNRYFASSPFSSDRNWSFCIYPSNTYFDFSTGHGGNIINLVSKLDGISLADAAARLKAGVKYEIYKPNYKKIKETLYEEKEFDWQKYVNKDEKEIEEINAYAKSRGITEGYFPGVFFTRSRTSRLENSGSNWVRVPALGFLHVDKNLKPCGAKFRKIRQSEDRDQSVRFSARGSLGFYILQSFQNGNVNVNTTNQISQPPVLYVIESETSANSLMVYGQERNKNCIVLSMGGVSSAPKLLDLPPHLQPLEKKLIIDYDGNEELYQQRLRLYADLKATPIKLELPKGEDINSLYCKGQMNTIQHLLF